jgi:hypothetical protein
MQPQIEEILNVNSFHDDATQRLEMNSEYQHLIVVVIIIVGVIVITATIIIIIIVIIIAIAFPTVIASTGMIIIVLKSAPATRMTLARGSRLVHLSRFLNDHITGTVNTHTLQSILGGGITAPLIASTPPTGMLNRDLINNLDNFVIITINDGLLGAHLLSCLSDRRNSNRTQHNRPNQARDTT